VRYLITTEEHPDHTTTTHFFPGTLISHEKTRERLAQVPHAETLDLVRHVDPEANSLLAGFRLRLADIVFKEKLSLYCGDVTLQLFHLPGHSAGGIGVYLPEDKVVFTTDIVFHRKKSWLHEATPAQWLESLQKLRELDAAVIVPGHGRLCRNDYLEEQASIVERWVEVV
jgi:cyclase